MDHSQHILNFIGSIVDDDLRDVYVRGKCRDVILPMVILRRFRLAPLPGVRANMGDLTGAFDFVSR